MEHMPRAKKMANATRVRDVMTPDPVTLSPTNSIRDAAVTMRDRGIGDVLVVDGDDVVGIVTDRDIVVRGLAGGDERATLADIVSREVTTIGPDDPVDAAVRLMRERAIRRLPVMDGTRPVGIVSLGDLALSMDRRSALADVSAALPNT
jgi:CBS domain-containing protein